MGGICEEELSGSSNVESLYEDDEEPGVHLNAIESLNSLQTDEMKINFKFKYRNDFSNSHGKHDPPKKNPFELQAIIANKKNEKITT